MTGQIIGICAGGGKRHRKWSRGFSPAEASHKADIPDRSSRASCSEEKRATISPSCASHRERKYRESAEKRISPSRGIAAKWRVYRRPRMFRVYPPSGSQLDRPRYAPQVSRGRGFRVLRTAIRDARLTNTLPLHFPASRAPVGRRSRLKSGGGGDGGGGGELILREYRDVYLALRGGQLRPVISSQYRDEVSKRDKPPRARARVHAPVHPSSRYFLSRTTMRQTFQMMSEIRWFFYLPPSSDQSVAGHSHVYEGFA